MKKKKEFISIINQSSPLPVDSFNVPEQASSLSGETLQHAITEFYNSKSFTKLSTPLFATFITNPKEFITRVYLELNTAEANSLMLSLSLVCVLAEKQSKSFVKYVKFSNSLIKKILLKNNGRK